MVTDITNVGKDIGAAQQTAVVEEITGCKLFDVDVPTGTGRRLVGLTFVVRPYEERLMKPTGAIDHGSFDEYREVKQTDKVTNMGTIFGEKISAKPDEECILIAKALVYDTDKKLAAGKLTVV